MTAPELMNGEGYVRCRVCEAAMRTEVSAAHLRAHMESGDLIRAAHTAEIDELTDAHREQP